MNPNERLPILLAVLLVPTFCPAQEVLDYMFEANAPQANYYTIAAQIDSALQVAPPDTSEESEGMLFGRWTWFWESRMGYAIDHFKTGKFSDYIDVMKSMVETPTCTNSSSYQASWNLLGPVQLPRQEMGWVSAVARDPNNASVVYVGAPNGGLWRTNDIDATNPTWHNITDQSGLPGLGVGSILIDPTNSDIIYIATGFYTGYTRFGVGVLKTTNGTSPLPTWEFTGVNYDPFALEISTVQKLVMSPSDHNTIYAFTGKDVFKSTDGGGTWPSLGLNTAIGNANLNISDLVLDPLNSSNLTVSVTLPASSLWHWNNSTSEWMDVTANLSTTPNSTSPLPIRLTADNNNIYALYKSINNNIIDISTTGGAQWNISTTTNNYGPLFIVSNQNSNIMYLGDGSGRVIYKSTDGGATFSAISNYGSSSLYHGTSTHGDIRALQLFSSSTDGLSDILLAGTDGGVLYSTSAVAPPGAYVNWRNVNGTGLAIGQFYGIAGSEKVPGRIVAGAQDNGFAVRENDIWSNTIVGDAYNSAIDHDLFSSVVGERISWIGDLSVGSYLIKSNNGGQSWPTSIPQPTWGNASNPSNYIGMNQISIAGWKARASPLEIDHANNMFLGFHDLFLFNSANMTWSALSDFTGKGVDPESGCNAFAVAPSNPNVIYFGFEFPTWNESDLTKKFWKTENGGQSWIDITQGIPVDGVGVSGIAIDPTNANRIWVSCDQLSNWGELSEPYNGTNRVFYSADGGATWTDFSKGLTPLPINTITYESGSNDGLYVGTDVGVFYTNRNLFNSDDIPNPNNTGWACFNDNFPACIVTDLEINYATNKLRASTYGRGIWESSLACPLEADLNFNTASSVSLTNTFQEAFNDISIGADAGNIALTNYTARAGNEVHVSPALNASVHFNPTTHLFIHPCSSPGNSFHPKLLMAGSTGDLDEGVIGATELQVFPNPSTGLITVKLRDAVRDQVSTVRLFDGLGKMILSKGMTGERTLLNMPFPDGIYTVVVSQAERKFSARIILKTP